MIAHLLLVILCLFVILSTPNKEKGLKWVFYLATIFLSIRYGWGNDYMSYLDTFNEYKSFSFDVFDIEASGVVRRNNEYGWVILNRLFGVSGLGFFGMVIVLTVFENWVIHRTIVKYVDQKYYWVSVLIYVFSSSFAINASMMRQYLCICLFLIVIDLMTEKKVKGYLLWSVGIIVIGSSIHRSFIMMIASLPLFYISIIQGKRNTFWSVALLLVFIAWSRFGRDIVEPFMYGILEENEDLSSYMFYLDLEEKKSAIGSGLGEIFRYVMFFMWLWILPKVEKKQQTLIMLLLITYFFDVVSSIVPIAGRFSLFFSSISLVCWSFFIKIASKRPWMYAIFVGEILILGREFIGFYSNPIWIDHFLHYHTILGAPSWM